MALEDQKATDRRALAERVQDALVRARRETVVNERLRREGRHWNSDVGATEAQRQAEESRLRERGKNEIDNLMAFEEIAALMRPLGQELAIAADVLAETAARSLEGRCQGPLSSAHRRPVFLPAGGHQNCPLV
ncbi:hypothetical protein ACH0BH_10170, partial [Micrococcus luteus]|uniref:hypothetical protein n=1 Tax=Micrococcus luteus TaxID=1270 RepID=UPI00387927BA